MTINVYTMTGCPHCATLESLISGAGLSGQVTFINDQGNGGCGGTSVPSTIINGVCHGFPDCDENCQFAAIQAAATSGTSVGQTTVTPTTTATSTTASAPVVVPTYWADTPITINWGSVGTSTGEYATTPVDWSGPPDVQLTPILPLPPATPIGLCVALRDNQRIKPARKVA